MSLKLWSSVTNPIRLKPLCEIIYFLIFKTYNRLLYTSKNLTIDLQRTSNSSYSIETESVFFIGFVQFKT